MRTELIVLALVATTLCACGDDGLFNDTGGTGGGAGGAGGEAGVDRSNGWSNTEDPFIHPVYGEKIDCDLFRTGGEPGSGYYFETKGAYEVQAGEIVIYSVCFGWDLVDGLPREDGNDTYAPIPLPPPEGCFSGEIVSTHDGWDGFTCTTYSELGSHTYDSGAAQYFVKRTGRFETP